MTTRVVVSLNPNTINRGYSNVWSEYDFYFISKSEKNVYFIRDEISHIHDQHLNFLFIIYIIFDRRDANIAFARGSLSRSFVPWR